MSVPPLLLNGLDLAAYAAINPSTNSPHKTDFADYGARLNRAWKQIKTLGLDKSRPSTYSNPRSAARGRDILWDAQAWASILALHAVALGSQNRGLLLR